jgi:ribosome-binding protein aMBF1 (putative translation factor)
MLDALAGVAREARVSAGLTQLDIATSAGTSHATISRLERAESWPLNPEPVISAYEAECGLDRGALWKRAAEAL